MAAARNRHKRRRRNSGRLGPVFKLLCIVAVVVAMTMGATVFFQVETVAVSGNSRYTEEDIVQAAGLQIGDNLFRMNKFRMERQVKEGLPYVEKLTIRRSLPSTIVITVWEWDAAAKIEAPEGTAPAAPAEETPGPGGESSSQEEAAAEDEVDVTARESWLISVKGKLLEPAPLDSTAISVTGLTALRPSAGTMLVVSQEETPKLEGLLSLMAALEEREMLARVSAIHLTDTRVVMRYLDRFDVEMPLNGDFRYHLAVLNEAVSKLNEMEGENCIGHLDLTKEDIQALYTPG